MTRSIERTLFFCLVLSVGLISCATPRLAKLPADQPEARHLAVEVYDRLAIRNAEVHTLTAAAHIMISNGWFTRAAAQAVLVDRPDHLRIDSFTVTGTLVHQLIYREGHLSLYNPESGDYQASHDVRALLRKELKLDLEASVLVDLMSGVIPLEDRDQYLAVKKGDEILLRGRESQIIVDAWTYQPRELRLLTPEGNLLKMTYDEYADIGTISIAHSLQVEAEEPRATLDITFKDISLNEAIAPEIFAPQPNAEAPY